MTAKKTSKDMLSATKKESLNVSTGAGDTSNSHPSSPTKRPPRIRMGFGMNLDIAEENLERDKYNYRWFAENDVKKGRVASADAAYYDHVTDESGNNITRPSGNDILYLMRLPMEYHLEDLKLKRKRVDATMVENYTVDESKGEYAPDGHKPEGGNSAITKKY